MSTEVKETALVTIEPTTALAVFTNAEKVDPILAAIRKIVAEFQPDTTTAKGRKEIASIANKVARSKTYLDDIGKKLTDEYKEIPKKIDANRKRIRDELDALKVEVRKPLTEWENAEAARVQGIKDRISAIYMHGAQTQDSVMVGLAIKNVEAIAIDESWQEFAAEAAQVKDRVLADLRASLESCLKREAEQAELQRLREEKAKRDAEERDRRIAEAAAEKVRKEAEEAAACAAAEAERKAKAEREAAERRELELKLAAEKAERERLEAIERAEREKQAAVEAERRKQEEAERLRLAEEARERAEAERRAADLANRETIHRAIMDALTRHGIPNRYAADVVSLLATESVPFVTVEY
jgi:hypothetical protein